MTANLGLERVCALVIPIFGIISAGSALGGFRTQDELFRAVETAGQDLATGKGRQQVLDHLRTALQSNPDSEYRELGQQLASDLDNSIQQTPSALPGVVKPLMDTTIPLYLLCRENERSWPQYIKLNPDDPTAHLLSADRNVIDKLIPMLSDLSPTRSFGGMLMSGDLPDVPRVCDYALRTIELHSRCRFHFNESTGGLFHGLPVDGRTKTIQRISEWWKENRNHSVADGIRAQLPHGGYHAKIWMAKQLAALEDGDRSTNRADAIGVLKTLVAENNGYSRVSAAEALARLGDLSPMKLFYQRCLNALQRPGCIIESEMVFYMTDHGTRQEWEILNQLAQRELDTGNIVGGSAVWPALVHCSKAKISKFAIPGLALALTKTEKSGSRTVGGGQNQSFSCADTAAELLQNLTGEDFGYRAAGSDAERSAAIEKAHAWWEAKGSKEYTFDRLEESAGKDGMPGENVKQGSPSTHDPFASPDFQVP